MRTLSKSSSFHNILILVFGIAFGLVALALIYKGVKTSNDIRSRAAGMQDVTYKSWEFNGATTEGWVLDNLTGIKVANGILTGSVASGTGFIPSDNVTLSNKSVATAMPVGNKYLKFRLGVFNPQQRAPISPQPQAFTIVASYMIHGVLQQKVLPAIPGAGYGNLYEYSVTLPDIGGITIDSIQMMLKPMRAGMSIQLDWVRLTGPPPPTPTPTPTSTPRPTPTSVPTLRPTPISSTTNPFGVMLGDSIVKPATEVGVAINLGARYYRHSVTLTDLSDNDYLTSFTKASLGIIDGGLHSILTIRYNGGQDIPSSPPVDMNIFKAAISQAIDIDQPTVVVYENEEDSITFGFFTGTNAQYLNGLKAVCEVAHQKMIKCANGGITNSTSVLLAASYYENEAHDTLNFNIVTDNTLSPSVDKIFKDGGRTTNIRSLQKRITKGKELVLQYRASGADYMNFHWYSQNAKALELVANYLKTQSGLEVITNEFGERVTDTPEGLTQIMGTIYSLKMPVAVEFSLDSAQFNDKSLVNPDGTLRPDGLAYQEFIRQWYR